MPNHLMISKAFTDSERLRSGLRKMVSATKPDFIKFSIRLCV